MAAKRLRIYLTGSPRFKIVTAPCTAHKPLLPVFNTASQKIPPRIEIWVMEMQDLDYEVLIEPGKDYLLVFSKCFRAGYFTFSQLKFKINKGINL